MIILSVIYSGRIVSQLINWLRNINKNVFGYIAKLSLALCIKAQVTFLIKMNTSVM